LVTVLYAPGTDGCNLTETEFISEIDGALANGRLVLVKGWRSQGLREFTVEAMVMAGFAADETVVVQGTYFTFAKLFHILTRFRNKMPGFDSMIQYSHSRH
jgi:hypothetical protein